MHVYDGYVLKYEKRKEKKKTTGIPIYLWACKLTVAPVAEASVDI